MLALDSTKAQVELEWSPGWRLEEALDATAEWYCTHAAGGDMRGLSLAQARRHAAAQASRDTMDAGSAVE
jgi:dTDP-D-glucose 4,6-dehydratase